LCYQDDVTMKTIQLIRHAKSSWEHPNLSDHERPLNERGMNDSQIMSQALFEAGVEFNQVYCSSANRAQLTIQNIAEYWQGRTINWQTSQDLYVFSGSAIWRFLQQLDDEWNHVTLLGHNPALSDFINETQAFRIDNLPTCAYVSLAFYTKQWCQIPEHHANKLGFYKPKMFRP